MLRELFVTRGIIESFTRELLEHTAVDVAVVGAGPSGLVAAYLLARGGKKVAVFERKLAPGGGIWGGGMLFNKVVVQRDAEEILKEFEINYAPYGEEYLLADAVELASTLISKAVKAGVKIFNGVHVEDVVIKNGKVGGVVINWTPVDMVGLHVDPLVVEADAVVDGTGHDAAIVKLVARRTDCCEVKGMGAMWVDEAERLVVEKSGEVYPGLFVAGMSTAELYGLPRMGPIFGGMFLSGKKIAEEILNRG